MDHDNSLQELIECPVCFEEMGPPLYQCSKGNAKALLKQAAKCCTDTSYVNRTPSLLWVQTQSQKVPCVQVAGLEDSFKHFLFNFHLFVGPTWTKLSQFDALLLKRWSGATNICVDTIGLDATQRCCGKIRGSMKRIVSTDLFHVLSNAASKVSLSLHQNHSQIVTKR